MSIAVTIDHGATFGRLTVLKRIVTPKRGDVRYRVGCECGNSSNLVSANQLVKGRVTECSRCRNGQSFASAKTKAIHGRI